MISFWECAVAGICGYVAGYTCAKLVLWVQGEEE